MLTGIACGLSTAWVWATTSLWAKTTSERVHPLSFNAFRLIVASLFFLLLLPFFGGWEAFDQISTSSRIALTGATIFGVCLGDSLYFWSMGKIGTSRALPIAGIYPLFTWALAVPLLGEQITVRSLAGTAFALAGVFLLSRTTAERSPSDAKFNRVGVIGALGAAVLWAIGTTVLKFGLQSGPNVMVVNAFRLPLSALMLAGIAQLRGGARTWDGIDRSSLPGLILLSIYSTGLGGILWVIAIDLAGAARAALLNNMSPLIGVPLAAIFLRERVNVQVAAGAVLSIIGIALIL